MISSKVRRIASFQPLPGRFVTSSFAMPKLNRAHRFTLHVLRITLHFFSAGFGHVTPGQSSVRNGDAGRPPLLQRFTTGKFAQP